MEDGNAKAFTRIQQLDRWLNSCLRGERSAPPPETERARRLLRFAQSSLDPLEQAPLADPEFSDELAVALADTGDMGPGTCIGAFSIERAIGAGGMGAVYLARRIEGGFEQRVALKVLTGAHPSPESYRQFAREREVLARLEHPNITRLIDGGMTEDARPWFAMEYVEGEPIHCYADSRSLSVGERLKLFVQVCQALEYAHSRLVLHRDIKPSNVLVTADGTVKLLDFGLGRIDQRLDRPDATVTRLSARWLTPEYASPEQIRGETITVASEIYQLGTLLYRLLCDHPPFELRDTSSMALMNTICESTPERPSACWQRGNEETRKASATCFGSTPESLVGRIRGDLDNIVLKSLAKNPQRRYQSVAELAEDIRRHQEHRPIRARAATRRYRLGKFIRRYKAVVVTTASIFVLITSGLIVITLQARQLTLERDTAAQESEHAKIEAIRAERVSEFLIDLFESADPSHTRGARVTVGEVLESGTSLIEQLEKQPRVQSRMMEVLSRVHRALGQLELSRELAEKAVEIDRRTLGTQHPDSARSLDNLGVTLYGLAEFSDAEQAHRNALKIARGSLEPDHSLVLSALNNLGAVLTAREAFDEAEKVLRESLAIREDRFGRNSAEVAVARYQLGVLAGSQGNYSEAQQHFQSALSIRRSSLGEDHPLSLLTRSSLADVLRLNGDYAAAEQAFLEVLETRRRVLGAMHPQVAGTLYQLGFARWNGGDLDGAETAWREAVAVNSDVLGDNHPATANARMGLAAIARDRGDLEETDRLLQEVMSHYRAHYGHDHTTVAGVLNNRGSVRSDLGDLEGARDFYYRALAIYEKKLGNDHPNVASVLHRIGKTYLLEEQHRQAEGYLARALEIRESALPSDHPRTLNTRALIEQLERFRNQDQ